MLVDELGMLALVRADGADLLLVYELRLRGHVTCHRVATLLINIVIQQVYILDRACLLAGVIVLKPILLNVLLHRLKLLLHCLHLGEHLSNVMLLHVDLV